MKMMSSFTHPQVITDLLFIHLPPHLSAPYVHYIIEAFLKIYCSTEESHRGLEQYEGKYISVVLQHDIMTFA